MKKYAKYKNSGIDWLGYIPENWTLINFNRICKLQQGLQIPISKRFYKQIKGSLEYITTKSIHNPDQPKQYVLNPNESVTCKESDILLSRTGNTGEVVTNVKGVFHNNFFKIDFNSTIVDKQFLVYYLNEVHIQELIMLAAGTTTIPDLNHGDFLVLPFIIPESIFEQNKIASFLDHKTIQIDTLIEIKEQFINKLKTQRRALINEMVTGKKAWNGYTYTESSNMKDSGIEWLGEISSKWAIKKIKHSCSVKGRIGWKGLKSDDYLDMGYSYLVTGTDFTGQIVNWANCNYINRERYDEDTNIQLINGDLLLTKDGTIGKTTLVKDLNKPACLNSGIFLIRSLTKELNINFLYWVLSSNIFKLFIDLTSSGSTIQHLYQNVFLEFEYAVPVIEEQIKIQKFLFDKDKEFENTIKNILLSIKKLKLYRQSLISEAVTGKINISDWTYTKDES